jgi:hypothetical protein
LLRTWVGSSSLTVALYGTPVNRRVVSETAPLVVTGPPPVKKVRDPSLFVGQTVVEEKGSPSLKTSNERKVYDADGKLLFDTTFYSSYRGEMKIIRIGTKKRPKDQTDTTTTDTTTATTTTTTKKPTTTTTTPRP